jgi:hypothetical protein
VDQNLLMLICIVLLPMIPAYLLFKALPSQGSLSGPLKGLNIKLGGAFAGYFPVLMLIIYTKTLWATPPPPQIQVWEVVGKLMDENDTAIEIIDAKSIAVVPATYQVLKEGKFQLKINTSVGPSGEPEYPTLNITVPNFREVSVPLEPADPNDPNVKVTVDKGKRRITFDRIRLKSVPVPPYAPPAAQLLAPLPPGKDYHE